MRIVYFSSIWFTDCDFPLIRRYQRLGNEVLYIITCDSKVGGLFKINTKVDDNKLYKADAIPEFKLYDKYLDLHNVFILTKSKHVTDVDNYKNYYHVIKQIKKFRPDVVHITWAPGISELLIYRFFRRLVLTVHDPFTHSGETNLNNEWKRSLAFHLSKKLILLNKQQRRDFVAHYHIKNSKVSTNTLGSYECLNYLGTISPVDISLPQKFILFFGHFSPYKGIDILCQAMLKVHQTHPDVKCIIAGKGDLSFDFTPYKGLNYIILMHKFIETDELATLIKNSLFTVCPYKDATQSGVVASSFALDTPVLATRVGGLPEAVIDGEKGLIVSPNDSEELADKIGYLLDNPEELKRMSINIKNDNDNPKNSWDTIAKRYIEIYKTV